MDYTELIKRLREAGEKSMCGECGLNLHTGATKKGVLFEEAADAIEELSHEYESVAKSLNESVDLVRKLQSPRWIPVAEQVPEERHDVLVYAGVMFPYITVGYYDGLWKFSFNDEKIAGGADYWMPLPQTPKEEKNEWLH